MAQTTFHEVAAWVFKAAHDRHARAVYIANAHTLNLATSAPGYRDVLNRGDLVLNDGLGLSLYARMAGTSFQENFVGTDLLPRLFAEADRRKEPFTVYLFGAKPGRAEKAAQAVNERYEMVEAVGFHDGYHHDGVVDAINQVSPDLVLVGMGNPLQEQWIDAHRQQLDAGVVFGIGALIDILSGEVRRAPATMRSMRLEWLFRLVQDPARLGSRYVKGNPVFLARSVSHLAKARRS